MAARTDFIPRSPSPLAFTPEESILSRKLQAQGNLDDLMQTAKSRCKEFNHIHWSIFFTRAKVLLENTSPTLSVQRDIIIITETLVEQDLDLPSGNLVQVVSGLGAFFIDCPSIWDWVFPKIEKILDRLVDTKELYLLTAGLKKINPIAYDSYFQRFLPLFSESLEQQFANQLRDFRANLLTSLIGLFNTYLFFPSTYDSFIEVAKENLLYYQEDELVNLLKALANKNLKQEILLASIEDRLCSKPCTSSNYAKAMISFCINKYTPHKLLTEIKKNITGLTRRDQATIFRGLAAIHHSDPDIKGYVEQIVKDRTYQQLYPEDILNFGLAAQFYLEDTSALKKEVLDYIIKNINISNLSNKNKYKYSSIFKINK